MTNEYIIQKKNYNRAFQFSAELNIKYDSADTVRCNSILVYKWLKEKFSRVYKLPYAIPSAFNKDKLDILYKPNEHFCCRFEHSDSKVQGRDWITEVEIISLDGKVLLGIKISYTTPEDSDYDRDIFSVPKFVWKIFSKNDLRDVRELKKNILEADTEEKLIELHDLIINEKRLFPVIVVTDSEYDTANWTEARIFSEGLLYRLGLVAHVAYLPREMCLRWKELVGEGWDVYNGAIRTIRFSRRNKFLLLNTLARIKKPATKNFSPVSMHLLSFFATKSKATIHISVWIGKVAGINFFMSRVLTCETNA